MSTSNGKAAPASKFAGRRIHNYQHPLAHYQFHPALREGVFNARYDVPAMLHDHAVQIGLWAIYGALDGAQFEVRANNKDGKAFIEAQIFRYWSRVRPKVMQSYVPYGTCAAEVIYEMDQNSGWWNFCGLDEFYIFDVQPWKRGRHMTKMRVSSAGMGMGGDFQEENLSEWNVIRHPKIFWCAHRPLYGNLAGHSSLEASWNPWMEKTGTGGGKSIRKLWFFSNAFRGICVKYPIGSTMRADGITRIDNRDIAQEIAEAACTGGAFYCPSGQDETGAPLWEIIDSKSNGDVANIMDYPTALDREIWQGMGVPDEILHAPETGGIGPVSREGPYAIFTSISDFRVRELITAFDVGPSGYTTRSEQAGGVLRNLCLENFGPKFRYQVIPLSLAPKPAEPGAGGSPASAPASATAPPPDQGAAPPPPPAPGAGPAPGVQLSTGTVSVELPDADVMAIWGGVQLSAHDVSGEARDAHGEWTKGGPLGAMAGAVGVSKEAYHAIHEGASEAFHSLPEPVQKAVTAVKDVAFTGWTLSQSLAERISKEKGSTPEQAAKTRETLAWWDLVAFKPMAMATAGLGAGIAAASWVVPPVTGAYLFYSTVRHPVCTALAAYGMVKDYLKSAKKVLDDHTATLSTAALSAPQALLLDAREKHDWDDWYGALLCMAIQETKDAERAIEVADAIFAERPKDKSMPQPNDADKLFQMSNHTARNDVAPSAESGEDE